MKTCMHSALRGKDWTSLHYKVSREFALEEKLCYYGCANRCLCWNDLSKPQRGSEDSMNLSDTVGVTAVGDAL